MKVEIAPGVEVEVVRPAIGSVVPVEEDEPGTTPGTHSEPEA